MTVDTERARHDQPPEHGEIHLPSPSAWPCVCAGGITLVFFGILTSFVFSVVGVLLIALALAGWIGELRHE
ncbi:MAG: hypothetical protein H0V51_23390 [Chloroflexi bacterium]|nr:hypothetical protein [Chloroflexota bacterium]